MKKLSRALLFLSLAALSACAPGTKSGVNTSGGDKVEDLTDRSVCGPARTSDLPLAGTSWSETLRVNGKVMLKRSLSFAGSTLIARQKATEILTGKTESLRVDVHPNDNAFESSEFGTTEKTLTLSDGTPFKFSFDNKVGLVKFSRTGNCLSITNGREINVLVPEL